jgi:hypothetical protein
LAAFSRAFFLRCRSRAHRTLGLSPRPIGGNRSARSRDPRSSAAAETQVMPRRIGLLVVPLLLAGCGSTQVAAEPTERVASPATFRSDARSICGELQDRVARLAVPARSDDPRLLHGIADAWAGAVGELRQLEPPATERRSFRLMLVHFDRAIHAARALPTTDDELAVAAVVGLLDQSAKGARIAESLGLADCSAMPAAAMEHELAALRKQFPRLRPLDQPAHTRRVGPRVEATAGP